MQYIKWIDNDAVTAAKIADNAVVTDAINADAVTAAKIADDAVGSEHIEDLSADLTLEGGVNLILATTTGTQIGEASNQLLGFYGATPVDQPATVSDATGTSDVVARLNEVIARLEELGLISSS